MATTRSLQVPSRDPEGGPGEAPSHPKSAPIVYATAHDQEAQVVTGDADLKTLLEWPTSDSIHSDSEQRETPVAEST
jgi:hypothetical protein